MQKEDQPMFTLRIETDHAAFEEPGAELARILRGLADKLEDTPGAGTGNLRDVNGNQVGCWFLSVD
jgi:hypothetical protein